MISHWLFGESYPEAQHHLAAAAWQRELGAHWNAQEVWARCGAGVTLPARVTPVVAVPRCRHPGKGLAGFFAAARRRSGLVVLRYAGEMNRLGYQPASFRAEWRHLYRRVRRTAPNVRLLWSVTGSAATTRYTWRYWPGRAYVAYGGWSAFRWPHQPGSFAQRFTTAYHAFARRRVPIILPELGVSRRYPDRSRAAWLAAARRWIIRRRWIKGVLYLDAAPPNGDWRLDNAPDTRREWSRWKTR